MRIFSYSFLKRDSYPLELVNLLMKLSALRAKVEMRVDADARTMLDMEPSAKVQSVAHSSAMEGVQISSGKLESIVSQHVLPTNYNELEVFGYHNALREVLFNYQEMELSPENILGLHRRMMCQAGYKQGGNFKQDDKVYPKADGDDRWHSRFRPTSAAETPTAMERLTRAYRTAVQDPEIPELLLIPCMVADFMYVLPFQEGNGRVSRLLIMLTLYQTGWNVGRFVPLEEKMHRHQAEYYEALRLSGRGWGEGKNDYTPFILCFLDLLRQCYQQLNDSLAATERSNLTKADRIAAVMLRTPGPLSPQEICSELSDVGRSTVESVLSSLLESGVVQKIGVGRTTRYVRI